MPRGKEPLAAREVAMIKQWIEQGAHDDTPASAKHARGRCGPSPDIRSSRRSSTAWRSARTAICSRSPAITKSYCTRRTAPDSSPASSACRNACNRSRSARTANGSRRPAAIRAASARCRSGTSPRRRLKLSLPVTFDTLYGVSWSPDSKLVAFGGADNSLRAIDAATGKQVLFQGGHSDWVLDTVFSVKGTHLVSVSRDRSMKLTEVATERLEDNITSITPGALKGGLQAVDRHPKKDELLIGGADGAPKLYQMYRTKPRQIGDDFNKIRAFSPPMPGRIFAVRFNPDGSKAIVGSSSDGKGEVRVYEVATGKLLTTLAGIRGPIYAVAYHPKEKLVASAGFDGTVYLHNPDNGQLIREFVPVPIGKQQITRTE